MEVNIKIKKLCQLYNESESIIKPRLQNMINNEGWKQYETENCFLLYKESSRMHCGAVIIVESLISNNKGEGTKALNYLKSYYKNVDILLDCKIGNSAIEFYKKQGFKIRANSLIYKGE